MKRTRIQTMGMIYKTYMKVVCCMYMYVQVYSTLKQLGIQKPRLFNMKTEEGFSCY